MTDIPCKMTMHNCPVAVEVGHYMASVKTGYRVIEARLVRGHSDKWALTCLRCPLADIPEEAVVHGIRWFSRSKKK